MATAPVAVGFMADSVGILLLVAVVLVAAVMASPDRAAVSSWRSAVLAPF